jgi:hypothetical protein
MCVFMHSCFIENPPVGSWETNPCFFWSVLSQESYGCGGLLNFFIHFFHILAHGYLFVILLWSLCEDSLLFYKSWHNGVYNYLNTCLYTL